MPSLIENNHKKIQIYDDLKNIDKKMNQFNEQDSQSMKNELQNFLQSQIAPSNDKSLNSQQPLEDVTQYVGTTDIDDIPITA
jgi:hypothetical protein